MITAAGKEIDLQVDGGVNNETGRICWENGANVLVAGSHLFQQADYSQAVAALRESCQ